MVVCVSNLVLTLSNSIRSRTWSLSPLHPWSLLACAWHRVGNNCLQDGGLMDCSDDDDLDPSILESLWFKVKKKIK